MSDATTTTQLQAALNEVVAERDELRERAHQYWVERDTARAEINRLTAGALHRALGTIGHSAPKCQAEAELTEVRMRLQAAHQALQRLVWLLSSRPELHEPYPDDPPLTPYSHFEPIIDAFIDAFTAAGLP